MQVNSISPGVNFETVYAPLEHAETLFQRQSNDKAFIKVKLDEAWSSLVAISKEQSNGMIPQQLENTAARLFHLYGRTLYGGDMNASANMFEIALAFQIKTAMKIEGFAIGQFHAQLNGNDRNRAYGVKAINVLLDGDEKEVISAATEQDAEASLLAGKTLRWMGHSLQNISSVANAENLPTFERIYGVCQKVLESIGNQDANWEVAELLYNTTRFIHGLKNPGDSLGGLATLDQLKPYLDTEGATLRGQKLRAQILNIRMIALGNVNPADPAAKAELLRTQYSLLTQAVDIAQNTEGFDKFLGTMFKNNKARLAMDCLEARVDFEVIDEVEISSLIDSAVSDMEANGYNHYYHAIFLSTAARFAEKQNDNQKALMYLKNALTVCVKFGASTADIAPNVTASIKRIMGKLGISF